MKKMKNQIMLLATILFLGLGITSCQKSETDNLEPIGKVRIEDNAAVYKKLMNARTNFKGSAFEILEIVRNANIVTIVVEGGCDTHAYKVIWDGVINFTEPANPSMVLGFANVVISHEPVLAVQCLAVMKHKIQVDLQILLGKAYYPNINLQVSNSSKIEDKIVDPNGVVTIKKK